MSHPRRLIVGITGASGVVYGVRLLELLKATDIETHLVMSKAAELTLHYESDLKPDDVKALANVVHAPKNIGATIASGSYKTEGMIVAPCSVKTMGEIATGITTGLVARAADVVLKERRRLVLMVRETPFHTGHLRTMTALSEMGAVIAPPLPAFYAKPTSLEQMVDHSLARVLDLFDIEVSGLKRWHGGQLETE
ncbi:UbiX family flavin prenyltransferase [Simiduia curdlanivorans]|uniref:Flavin prenyltransferase UbiX n=1 Tax=Simiduia curdlanivorans TaxID=1492769 RepID=A0ABV8V5I9_9GAMM|nr:UbiX family flavin prenyltransferase [Simiduia curdlanivorans]MDN3641034.1 UbiX family flavin prenyltransferase [Simiduia curdlanivorans]